ncbi:RraA family protein [Rhodobacterales bacterium HKCCD6035]|jgi:4-hydroxy-4-methyl-2-oxoglutarate aldolase|nr:RraA family protein [Rhodobacterales bacterium HKCCD6035]
MHDLTTRLERLYSSAVYDALRALGHDNCVLPHGISALIPGQKLAGEIFTIDGHYEVGQDPHSTLLSWSTVLSKAPSGKVLICQPNTYEVALMGELSSEVLKNKGVKGYIVDGATRDVSFILENEFPTFCRFNTPKDIVGRWVAKTMGEPIEIGGVSINSGDYVIADLDGVVIIPRMIAEDVVKATEEKASTETEMRAALMSGMDPVDAYKKYGVF